jgi:hypothetical protein
MSKGRPPINPRIDALERDVAELKRQLAAMNDSFSRGNIPQPSRYQSLFERWPNQASQK